MMKIGDEVYIHGYIDEIRKDVVIIKNNGGYFGTIKGEIYYNDGNAMASAVGNSSRYDCGWISPEIGS